MHRFPHKCLGYASEDVSFFRKKSHPISCGIISFNSCGVVSLREVSISCLLEKCPFPISRCPLAFHRQRVFSHMIVSWVRKILYRAHRPLQKHRINYNHWIVAPIPFILNPNKRRRVLAVLIVCRGWDWAKVSEHFEGFQGRPHPPRRDDPFAPPAFSRCGFWRGLWFQHTVSSAKSFWLSPSGPDNNINQTSATSAWIDRQRLVE
jgi:hypothetical protein